MLCFPFTTLKLNSSLDYKKICTFCTYFACKQVIDILNSKNLMEQKCKCKFWYLLNIFISRSKLG